MYSRYEQTERRVQSSQEPLTTGSTYRSAMAPRVTNVQRSRQGGLSGAGVMTRVYQSFQSTGGSGNFGQGLAALASFPGVPIRGGAGGTGTALVAFNAVRQRDKRDLVQLNDKFAQYIEKVRFLEAQNRKLVLEIEALRSRSGVGSSRIREMFDIEIGEAHKLIEGTKADAKAATEKADKAEQDLRRLRGRYAEISHLRDTDRKEIDAMERQIAENQAQIQLFRRRIADLDDETRRYKAESQRISSEIGRLQGEIQNEMFIKSSCEVEKLGLEDELATIKHTHEADLAELRSRNVSTDLDPSHFFRNELATAIREIRNDYENAVESQRTEMQNRYTLLYNELIIQQQRPDTSALYSEQQRRQEERVRSELLQTQNQSGYLRAQNQDVRNRIDELKRKIGALREDGSLAQAKLAKEIQEAKNRLEQANRGYDEVSNLKTSLEKEISTYRDLLESQNGLRGYVDRIVQNAEQQALERPTVRTGGGSTIISRTVASSNFGGNLISSSTRQGSTYQSTSSSVRSSYSPSVSPTRRP